LSSQTSPVAAPQVGHGTDNICSEVSKSGIVASRNVSSRSHEVKDSTQLDALSRDIVLVDDFQ
jgi:hypothetical protein